jgi:hypothetical protein
MTVSTQFKWVCQPKAEALLTHILEECCNANPFIAALSQDLLTQTSTRLFDWLDHVVVGYSPELESLLSSTGFVSNSTTATYHVFHHPGAQLPRIIMRDDAQPIVGIAVAVDSIANFLMVRGMGGAVEGTFLSNYRRCCVSSEQGVSLWVVERRGSQTMEPVYTDENVVKHYLEASEKWRTRPRNLDDEEEAMSHTLALAEQLITLVGKNLAAWIILEVERDYWQSRNTAGQLQKNRQDRLGMGWANHDHHTFRSSRRHFFQLIRLFEMLGFQCRERFYAGQEAGWGAQVMEHSVTRLVLFLDVDLLPEELDVDFRHHSLTELNQLGTVGLWCALHGDSILRAGMHHLEAQFMFDELTQDLSKEGITMMAPFSNFPYLRQAFTKGEMWTVHPRRLQKLLEKGVITKEDVEQFLTHGAIGSHMENLQRRQGFKGFNSKSVSSIIQQTDPRKNL